MKRMVIALVALIAVLVVADLASASAAEYKVSQTVRQRLALPDDPEVKINGFPFLLQALRGDYRSVDVSADQLAFGRLREVGLRAQLYHVRVPLRQLLGGRPDIQIDSARGSLQITRDDLVRMMPGVTKLVVGPVDRGALNMALADAANAVAGSSTTGLDPDQAVRMVASTTVLGQRVDVSCIALLQLNGGRIVLSPRDIRIGSGPLASRLPDVVQRRLRDLFSLRIDPGALPFAVSPTSLEAVDNGLLVSGEARELVLPTGSGAEPAN